MHAFWYGVNAAKIAWTSVEEVRLQMRQQRDAGRLRGGRFIIDESHESSQQAVSGDSCGLDVLGSCVWHACKSPMSRVSVV